jgi:hypothetical protein
MTVQMDDRFSHALRLALLDHVQEAPARRRRARLQIATACGICLLALGGGVAAASILLRQPGADLVTRSQTRSRRPGRVRGP